jgi:hypothetical protein
MEKVVEILFLFLFLRKRKSELKNFRKKPGMFLQIRPLTGLGQNNTKFLLFALNKIYVHCGPHDEYRSSGPRPVKLCSDLSIFQFFF